MQEIIIYTFLYWTPLLFAVCVLETCKAAQMTCHDRSVEEACCQYKVPLGTYRTTEGTHCSLYFLSSAPNQRMRVASHARLESQEEVGALQVRALTAEWEGWVMGVLFCIRILCVVTGHPHQSLFRSVLLHEARLQPEPGTRAPPLPSPPLRGSLHCYLLSVEILHANYENRV